MPIALKANVTRGQTSNDNVCQDGSDKDKDEEEEFNSIVKNLWKLFKKGNRFKRENFFGNSGDRFDRGHRSKGVGSSRGKRNCYGCGSKNHFVDDCLKAKMNKAFVGGDWSDSEDGDQIEKDAKCLMAIGSQKGSTCKDIYFLPLQRYQPSSERPRSHHFDLTKGGEGKQRAKAYGEEDKLLKLKKRKLTMHALSKGALLSCFVVISFAFEYIFVIIKNGEIVGAK
ncbi:putative reverse transcriptase domain-containing protein [Tanacetum coccineum]